MTLPNNPSDFIAHKAEQIHQEIRLVNKKYAGRKLRGFEKDLWTKEVNTIKNSFDFSALLEEFERNAPNTD